MFFKTMKGMFGKKFLLLLIIVSTILTAVTSCFVYGIYQNYHTKISQGESEEKAVIISALNNVGVQTSHSEYVEKFGEESMSAEYTSISKGDAVKMLMDLPESVMKDIDYVLCDATMDDNVFGVNFYTFQFKVTPDGLLPYGDSANQFTNEQYISGECVARIGHILLTDEAESCATGTVYWENDGARKIESSEEYLEIGGQKYKIIGENKKMNLDDYTIFIPFTSLNDNTPLRAMYNTISINFKDPVTYRQYNEIQNSVNRNVSDKAFVKDMDLTISADIFFYKTMIAISGVVTLLFAVNLVLIYSYAVQQNKKKIAIYRICGCTRRNSIRLFILQAAIICVPVFILSQFIFNKFLYPVMTELFPFAINSFSFLVYALMFVSYIIVSFIILEIMLTQNIGRKVDLMEDIQ